MEDMAYHPHTAAGTGQHPVLKGIAMDAGDTEVHFEDEAILGYRPWCISPTMTQQGILSYEEIFAASVETHIRVRYPRST